MPSKFCLMLLQRHLARLLVDALLGANVSHRLLCGGWSLPLLNSMLVSETTMSS